MIVVVDTNALASAVRTAGAPLAHLTAYTRRCKSVVYLPQVVKKELRAYLDRFKLTVQRYFPLRAGSPPEAFAAIAGRYPVFEMMPSNDRERGRGEGAR